MPPEGFAALFNGKDLTGWHTPPEVLENWFLEDGVLKSPGLVEHYRARLLTKELYRDFILMFEFRMPTISDRSNFLRCATESSCKSLCRPLSTFLKEFVKRERFPSGSVRTGSAVHIRMFW